MAVLVPIQLWRRKRRRHHLLTPGGRPRRMDAALERSSSLLCNPRRNNEQGSRREGQASGDAGEAVISPPLAVGLRLRGEGEVRLWQPGVPARQQRRFRLRASNSGEGEDGAFCSPPVPAVARAHAGPSTPASSSAKVCVREKKG